jgi:protein-tyrosine phosphatase
VNRGPIPGSRWVEEDRLLVGPYPGDRVEDVLAAGIDVVVDLTQEGELPAYGVPAPVRHVRRPIRDFGCPTSGELRETLDLVERELASGNRVYLHCRGGVGRTGTVVACYLVGRGATADEALARLRAIGKGPEAEEQLILVASWATDARR